MIEIKNLVKSYNGRKALNNVSLSIGSGEIVGLFGENGAGKTTLMKCILGFLRYSGEITFDGSKVTPSNIAGISFATSEHSFFPNLTPREHRDFYAMHFPCFNNERYSALMDFFSLPRGKALKHFSTGQKNQFEVIMALSQGARLILMDEPFAGNDIFNREDFYKVLLGILEPTETVLISTHLIEEVENFISRAVILSHGEISADASMSELEDKGLGLVSFIKEVCGYDPYRVGNAISRLTEKPERKD